MGKRISRRAFLKGAAVGGGGLVILSSRSLRTYAANNKPDIAVVGCGGRGGVFSHGYAYAGGVKYNVAALCDVNGKKAQQAYKTHPNVPKFHDYRKLLDDMSKQIDGVIVATPDHSHAAASVMAMRAGKPVYCEKPLTGGVNEARKVREVAEKQKVATQMGNQGASSGQCRRGIELVQDGVLGDIKEIYFWCEGSGYGRKAPPSGSQPVPHYLKWDLWLGPAKYREFHSQWMAWNAWRELGTGLIGNRGSHTGFLLWCAMKIGSLWEADPKTKPRIKASARVPEINRLSFPRWEVVELEVSPRENLPSVTVTWMKGRGATEVRKRVEDAMGRKIDWGDAGDKKWKDYEGALIVGTKGKLHAMNSNHAIALLPADKFAGVDINNPKRIPASRGGPVTDWIASSRDGKQTLSNFSNSGMYTEFLMLANISTQFDSEIEYDPLEGKIVNNAKADALLRRPYRDGWAPVLR